MIMFICIVYSSTGQLMRWRGRVWSQSALMCTDDVGVRRRRDAVVDGQPTGGSDARRRRSSSVRRRRQRRLDAVSARRQRSPSRRSSGPPRPRRLYRRTCHPTPAVPTTSTSWRFVLIRVHNGDAGCIQQRHFAESLKVTQRHSK